ncbi:DNA alkylation repair protein [bacterium]|nr:DNA alkylation repair protein [bacterium]
MTVDEILAALKDLGRESTARVLRNHGAHDPCYGVKIGDLKFLHKRIKTNYQLALDLYDTGVYDAMYLAGMIADDARMTKRDLTRWIKTASKPIASYVVAPVAAGSPVGWDLALEWIESKKEMANIAGWSTLSAIASVRPDTELDLSQYRLLLNRVTETISQSSDSVRYQMNAFVIAVGCFVAPLNGEAKKAALKIGPVDVDMGKTDCQVPLASDYIRKVEDRGTVGKKRKSAKC